jgi:hypothetical protein
MPASMPTMADLERELVKRKGLHEFVRLAWPLLEPSTPFIDNWHIQAVCEHVQALYDGDISNLLINIPPRTLKSLTCSVFAPAWIWTKVPAMKMIFASYSEGLSMGDSIKTRQIIESQWFQERWGHVFQLSDDQNTKTNFENNKAGARVSTSVGGTVTGKGATIITCDDLLSKDQSESQAFRDRAERFRFETLPSRFNDRAVGRSLDIQQRLHPNDTTGSLLERERDGRISNLTKLILPMEYKPTTYVTVLGFKDPRKEEGESLHEARFTPETIKGLKDELGSYAYAGQYSQDPVPREGGMVKEAWFKNRFDEELNFSILNKKKGLVMVVQSADCASKAKQRNDPIVWGTWGIFRHEDNTHHVELWDVELKRCEFPEGLKIFKRKADAWSPELVLIEDKDAGQQFIQVLPQKENDYPYKIEKIDPEGLDKGTRMSAETATIERGEMWLPIKAPWLVAYTTELCLFTGNNTGKDDQVDMTSQFLKWYRRKFRKRKVAPPSGIVEESTNQSHGYSETPSGGSIDGELDEDDDF